MAKISIVVVDDHPIFRQGVVDTLALQKDFEILGQAAAGQEAFDLIVDKRPQVAIIDVNLPEINGQQLTRQLRDAKCPTRVILLTAYDDASQEMHSIAAGASAYCVKDIAADKLMEIVRAVAQGSFVVAEQVMDEAALAHWQSEHSAGINRAYSDPGAPFEPLSKREMEVLECVTHGMSNKEIAMELEISHQTVKNHVTAVLRKLNVEDRTQAAVYALRRGWVRLVDPGNSSPEPSEAQE